MTRSTVPFALIFALLSWQLGCAAGAIGLPPSRTDFASQVGVTNGQTNHAQRISSGVHYASATTSRNVKFDIGGGVVYERRDSRQDGSLKAAEPAIKHDLGGYLEVSRRIARSRLTRTWLGTRAEVLRDVSTHRLTASATARVSWEIFAGGQGAAAEAAGRGFAMAIGGGTFGIGSYVESGVRYNPSGQAEFLMSAGLSMRLPGFVAVAVGFK